GKSLAVTVVDDATDPPTAQNLYTKFINDNPPAALIGTTGSPAAVLIQSLVYNAQIIDITPSASTPFLTDAQPSHDRYMFRTAASHLLQAKALAKWMVRGPVGGVGCKKPIAIYQDDAFGAPIALNFVTFFNATVDGGAAITPIK